MHVIELAEENMEMVNLLIDAGATFNHKPFVCNASSYILSNCIHFFSYRKDGVH